MNLRTIGGVFGALALTACASPERISQKPSLAFAGKKFSIALLQAPPGVPFQLDHLHRLVWQWRDSSPWFKEQMLGVSSNVLPAGSLATLLPALEENLRTRSELLILLQPRRFRWVEKGLSGGPSDPHSGGPILDEAEFLVSLADVRQEKEVGSFQIRVARRSEGDLPILEKLAYEVASKAGFGWQVK